MERTFKCSIVTPTEAVFDGEVTYASIPAWDGQLGVMTGQSPMLTTLGPGTLRLEVAGGGSKLFLIDAGFGQIGDNELTLLTESATPAEELSLEEAEAEVAEASAQITASGVNLARAERDQKRALAKRALAKSAASR